MYLRGIRITAWLGTLCMILSSPTVAVAQDAKTMVRAHIDEHASRYAEVAQTIWDYAEVGYQEVRSSALLQSTLADAGFTIEVGVAEIGPADTFESTTYKSTSRGIISLQAEKQRTKDKSPEKPIQAFSVRNNVAQHQAEDENLRHLEGWMVRDGIAPDGRFTNENRKPDDAQE